MREVLDAALEREASHGDFASLLKLPVPDLHTLTAVGAPEERGATRGTACTLDAVPLRREGVGDQGKVRSRLMPVVLGRSSLGCSFVAL